MAKRKSSGSRGKGSSRGRAPKPRIVKRAAPKEREKVTEKPAETEEQPKEEKKTHFEFKLFDRWDMNVVVADLGLRDYINLKAEIVPFSAGRTITKQFWKSKKNIVERLIGKIMVAGHRGKKHWRTSGHNTGKYLKISKIVREAFEIIEERTGKNPGQVYIDAIVNGSPREGVTTIEYGGVRYPKAVDVSPQRRIDLVLRWLTQGAYANVAASKGKKHFKTALAEQIILTAQNDAKSSVVTKKTELERQAAASR